MVHEYSGKVRVGRELSSLRVHGGVGDGIHLVKVLALCLCVRAAWPGDKYRIYPCQDLSYSVGKASA